MYPGLSDDDDDEKPRPAEASQPSAEAQTVSPNKITKEYFHLESGLRIISRSHFERASTTDKHLCIVAKTLVTRHEYMRMKGTMQDLDHLYVVYNENEHTKTQRDLNLEAYLEWEDCIKSFYSRKRLGLSQDWTGGAHGYGQ